MNRNQLFLSAILVAILVCGVRGECPSADLTGDCFVDFEDFAILASQWLTVGIPIPSDMVLIPAGTFQMGDSFNEGYSDELPLHTVQLDSFAMGKFEVTNQQYCYYLNSAIGRGSIFVSDYGVVYGEYSLPYCDTSTSHPYSQIYYDGFFFYARMKGNRSMFNDPMVMVSYYGAAAYCNWRSQQEGKELCYDEGTLLPDLTKHGFRLPTEAEWEYAARGGLAEKRFPWGDSISHRQANYHSLWEGGHPYYPYDVSPTEGCHPLWNDGNSPYTSPVGFFDGTMKYKIDFHWPGSATSYQTTSGTNNYGLYDMAGNVFEWCNDWYDGSYYSSSPYYNPPGPTGGSICVYRGGSCNYYTNSIRVVNRDGDDRTYRSSFVGFRCVLDLE